MADHVFISYAREDQAFVLALAERLRDRGVQVWLDRWNLSPGETWVREIDNALAGCACCVVVLSPDSARSDVVLAEYNAALEDGKRVVPLLYRACRVPFRLRPLQRVECRGRGAEDEGLLREMLDALGVAAAARLVRGQPPDPRLEAALARFRLGQEELIHIPAGEFLMGGLEEEGADFEHPQRLLDLPEYYIMRAPVTNAQYALFVEAGGYREQTWWTDAGWVWRQQEGRTEPGYRGDQTWNQPDYPVVGVSWYEALAFARWAGGALPSEAEWEKAASWDARAQRKRRYPWGDTWDAQRCNTQEKGPGRTTPVGHYSPRGDSAYGLVDMAGNVWEWTRSRWGEDWGVPDFKYPYVPGDGREDLAAADLRVLRGGSWYDTSRGARCAVRSRYLPDNWYSDVGFRACVSLAFSGF
jgi:formylglycine-generating enzyme required for sulfatase activity